MVMKILNVDVERIGHDTFCIVGSRRIYTDPFKIAKSAEADIVLITHEHFDHLSVEDLNKVCTPATTIVASSNCRKGLAEMKVKEMRFLDPGGKTKVGEVEIEAVAAYNINKFREPGKVFHPKEYGGVGFVVRMDGTTVYLAGDTDRIPEMKSIRCDIALLPVSGTYVMTAEEAAEAAAHVNPKIAIPMHYGAIVGGEEDAKKFKSLVKNCEVVIL
jgi:L-ascorbate metabolism protein UlaG (beta-lactamase superfamily)